MSHIPTGHLRCLLSEKICPFFLLRARRYPSSLDPEPFGILRIKYFRGDDEENRLPEFLFNFRLPRRRPWQRSKILRFYL